VSGGAFLEEAEGVDGRRKGSMDSRAGGRERGMAGESSATDLLSGQGSELGALGRDAHSLQKGGAGTKGGESCCKICPLERFPYRGVTGFRPEGFLQIAEKAQSSARSSSHLGSKGKSAHKLQKVGQSGCCPVCPTLYSMANGGTEPFGGPFGMGDANVKEAMEDALRTQCHCYPNCSPEEQELPQCNKAELEKQASII